jgi:hypothetical protein
MRGNSTAVQTSSRNHTQAVSCSPKMLRFHPARVLSRSLVQQQPCGPVVSGTTGVLFQQTSALSDVSSRFSSCTSLRSLGLFLAPLLQRSASFTTPASCKAHVTPPGRQQSYVGSQFDVGRSWKWDLGVGWGGHEVAVNCGNMC